MTLVSELLGTNYSEVRALGENISFGVSEFLALFYFLHRWTFLARLF